MWCTDMLFISRWACCACFALNWLQDFVLSKCRPELKETLKAVRALFGGEPLGLQLKDGTVTEFIKAIEA